MKIVFDSEEQKEDFIFAMQTSAFCPKELQLKDDAEACKTADCSTCWLNAIEMEVADGDDNGYN